MHGKKYDPRYEGLMTHDLRRSAIRNLVTVTGVLERGSDENQRNQQSRAPSKQLTALSSRG
jgi:hypothetical protein